ncbi:YqgE/AlgH family protein [Roseinatronobacter sp. S2]|uniref:YqgE/AlgH family protein n=1 Tax=Roseinatronobacter sp. S2 TaxID=3035471 RepID=UPI00240FD37C|nr:YqgE/AlgH family protein [Roseinatronobacter sp. S2]WFE74973.1 YqgE/AlgH family protein [Roseinatronobacter sp. S2]
MASLTGKLLIATPAMPDPRFAHAVVFLCAQSGEGTMGLIINKPLPDLTIQKLAHHLQLAGAGAHSGLADGGEVADGPVHFGGPVETGRGFVLHSQDYFSADGSVQVMDGLVLTTSSDVLAGMARGQGPAHAIAALGYAGWGAEQLERELHSGGWLLADADPDLLFATPDGEKWDKTLRSIGVDPRMLSGRIGHA